MQLHSVLFCGFRYMVSEHMIISDMQIFLTKIIGKHLVYTSTYRTMMFTMFHLLSDSGGPVPVRGSDLQHQVSSLLLTRPKTQI